MSTPRIEWNIKAFRELRTDPAIVADIQSRAERIAETAGDGFEASVRIAKGGRGRAIASARTATPEAMKAESDDMALTSAIDAGR